MSSGLSNRVVVFANPISGRGRGQELAAALEQRLSAEGYHYAMHLDRPSQMRADPRELRAAIVIGGDGTLRDVAAWAIEKMLERGPIESMPPLLVVPMGTANLMGQYLGVAGRSARDLDRVMKSLREMKVARLDAAQANGSLCLLVAGVGLDGAIVHELDRLRNGPISKVSYVWPSLRAVLGYNYPRLTVTVDGRRVFDDEPGMAFVGNVPQYGTGFPMLPLARPDDEALDVCVFRCQTFRQMVNHFVVAAAGEHLRAEGVVYAKGRSIRIESSGPVPLEVDGEAAGFTPLHIELLPTKVPFVLP